MRILCSVLFIQCFLLTVDFSVCRRTRVTKVKTTTRGCPLENANIESIVKYIKSGECKNIITMAGAGISTSAGIPDFRSPGSGLYDNLEKYRLPSPMAIFELDYFRQRPEAFFTLAKELYPGSFKPTPCHYFIKLLHQKKLLLRHFTQNIDNLERIAGLPDEALVEAHGSFHLSHCLTCRQEYSLAWMKERIFSDVIPSCDKCNGLVKPDIVFFGENLPSRYFHRTNSDFPKADLLLIMGTSLVVQPFCSLVNNVPEDCPRLLINKEKVGTGGGAQNPLLGLLGLSGEGLAFDSDSNVRDVFLQGECDAGCTTLAHMLGWGEELKQMIKEEHAKLDLEIEKEKNQRDEKKLAEDSKPEDRKVQKDENEQDTSEKRLSGRPDVDKLNGKSNLVDKVNEKDDVVDKLNEKDDKLNASEVDKLNEKMTVADKLNASEVDKLNEKTTVADKLNANASAVDKLTENAEEKTEARHVSSGEDSSRSPNTKL